MTKLSVNINKIATLRNARGGKTPSVIEAAISCQDFGADGITVHPRPDERHITTQDTYDIKSVIDTEYNIEGYPSEDFISMVIEVMPDQVTLVPDGPDVITSCAGWDTIKHQDFLKGIVGRLQRHNIRTSIFVDPDISIIEGAKSCGTDSIELYTEKYVKEYHLNREIAIDPYVLAARKARELNLRINAGHDLNLENLKYFVTQIEGVDEVSIGHAIISDSLYYGLENTILMYKKKLL